MLRLIGIAVAAAALAAAVGGYAGFRNRIHAIPYEEMARVGALMVRRAGANTMVLSAPASPSTTIPRNNPDTRPTYCWLDLSDGPVRVFGPLPESYWSLSIYTPDSLNPFVISDRELAPAREYDFLVARRGEAPETAGDRRVIEVDADQAAVLLRWYVPTPEHVAEIDALRRAGRCEPFQPS